MADYFEVHGNIGLIWQRCCGIWAEYVVNESWVWDAGYTTTNMGGDNFFTQVVIVDTGDEVNTYNMVANDGQGVASGTAFATDYLSSRPGWHAIPPVVNPTYGDRVTLDDWAANMVPLRSDIITQWTGHAPIYITSGVDGGNIYATTYHFTLQALWRGGQFTVDWTTCEVWDPDAEYQPYNRQAVIDLSPSEKASSVSSGISQAQIDQIVEAIQSVADRDTDVTANNGGNMWTLRGNVRTGP